MVNATYDSLMAIFVVGVIFVGAVVVLPAMSLTNLQAVDQQQLKNTALNVFNAILLDSGEPANWGLTSSNVQRFGLATTQDRGSYVLDPNKVQRLISESPYYIDPAKARDVLGLAGYGFNLTIAPPFTVDYHLEIHNVSETSFNMKLDVNVSYRDGRPIPNASSKQR